MTALSRRDVLRLGLLAATGSILVPPDLPAALNPPTSPCTLPPLPYAYDALEPHVDAATMRLHHDPHHQTYIDNLNQALAECPPEFHAMSIEDILRHLPDVPEKVRTAVRNHGGGHANHQLFWKIMAPPGQKGAGGEPAGALAEALTKDFGGVDAFKTAFQEAGAKVFGSGWVFLVLDPKDGGRLKVHATANQDSVLLEGLPALLGNDVWEHAYYLKHQNRRADYLQGWWNVVAWDVVNARLEAMRSGNEKSLGGATA